MSKGWAYVAAVVFLFTIGGTVLDGAQVSPPKRDTYTWHGELVSVDPTAMTMTVKSRVVYQEALSALKRFKAGDRVWIVWSGVHDSSDAVREVRQSQTGRSIDEHLVLPAELVSSEAPHQYISIRVKVPEHGWSAIKHVKPGEWVTVTSRHRPTTDSDAVVAVRPYSSTATTD